MVPESASLVAQSDTSTCLFTITSAGGDAKYRSFCNIIFFQSHTSGYPIPSSIAIGESSRFCFEIPSTPLTAGMGAHTYIYTYTGYNDN